MIASDCRCALAWVVPGFLLGGLAAGCAASEAREEKATSNDDLNAVRDLESELYAGEAGKVLAKAIRAHGGWEAWFALQRISYRLTRTAPAAGGAGIDQAAAEQTAGQDASPPAEAKEFQFDGADLQAVLTGAAGSDRGTNGAQGVNGGAGGNGPKLATFAAQGQDEKSSELRTLALPFLFASRVDHNPYQQEYLGVEIDAASGMTFEKVRFARQGSLETDWAVAYFERTSGILERTLRPERGGAFVETRFSAWGAAGGLRLPTARQIFLLADLSRHPNPGKPDSTIVLTLLEGQ